MRSDQNHAWLLQAALSFEIHPRAIVQSHYGSFYLDLPNLFPGEDSRRYYQALLRCGVSINESEFHQRFREMGRYVGFKYLGFVLSHWHLREQPGSWVRASLNNLIDQALNGSKLWNSS